MLPNNTPIIFPLQPITQLPIPYLSSSSLVGPLLDHTHSLSVLSSHPAHQRRPLSDPTLPAWTSPHLLALASDSRLWVSEIFLRYVRRMRSHCAHWWAMEMVSTVILVSSQIATLGASNSPIPSSSRRPQTSCICWPWAWPSSWSYMSAPNSQLSVCGARA